jgi:hypothetical protein
MKLEITPEMNTEHGICELSAEDLDMVAGAWSWKKFFGAVAGGVGAGPGAIGGGLLGGIAYCFGEIF